MLDEAARIKALDARQSFIVEAPAGSGKTALLVKRYLRLLSLANHPEEILAITFTKKASHEMRMRVMQALTQKNNAEDLEQLAQAVRVRSLEKNWQLLENPNRLMIQTIDALCMRLANHLPITSGFGGSGDIAEKCDALYRESIQFVLNSIDEESPYQAALIHLFTHFDNRYQALSDTLLEMLKKRDQWLPLLYINHPDALRTQLENDLVDINVEILSQLSAVFPEDLKITILPLLRYAADNVGEDSPIYQARDLQYFPDAELEHLPYWQAIAELLLTKENQFRKQVNKNTGFPPAKNDHKSQMQTLLSALSEDENILNALQQLREVPPLHFTDESWAFMQSLLTILPRIVSQLMVSFQQIGQMDFIEVAQRALIALGEEEAPTDLALVLDYQIRHLLIDEFQDTSITQFRLLERLLSGWEYNDGRTLFVVGDPQQSIYRFREARVGLFLQAKYHGMGSVMLEPLQLHMNFRSTPGLIDYINTLMPNVMPKMADITSGAIPFTPCTAARAEEIHTKKECVLFADAKTEAMEIAEKIKTIKATHPDYQVAILVRARSHLAAILPQLKAAGIAYQAMDIESLFSLPIMNDLLALTRALLHPFDRIAWLALLRSPICGLPLNELEIIANSDPSGAIWQNIQNCTALLSSDSVLRINRFVHALKPVLNARARMPLAQWVRCAWVALGGEYFVTEPETQTIEYFFQALSELKTKDGTEIEQYLATLYSNASSADLNPVQVMTIHKSKGLEFDVVFLPQLSRKSAVNKLPLLRYMQQTTENGDRYLLAPIHAKIKEKDPVYTYLGRQEKQQETYETQRLLYVALTRAKQQLYLSAVGDSDTTATGSLFALMSTDFVVREKSEIEIADKITVKKLLHRLPSVIPAQADREAVIPAQAENGAVIPAQVESGAVIPAQVESGAVIPAQVDREAIIPAQADREAVIPAQAGIHIPEATSILWNMDPRLRGDDGPVHDENTVDVTIFTPDNIMRRHAGTLLHRILRYIAENKLNEFPITDHIKSRWRTQLQALGVQQDQINTAIQLIIQGITHTLQDEKGRWILHPHPEAACEQVFQFYANNQYQRLIIDRTFVENDTRWIIDYKSGDIDLETHGKQLQQYARIMRQIDHRKIRLALYYPLIPAWREIDEITSSPSRRDFLARTV